MDGIIPIGVRVGGQEFLVFGIDWSIPEVSYYVLLSVAIAIYALVQNRVLQSSNGEPLIFPYQFGRAFRALVFLVFISIFIEFNDKTDACLGLLIKLSLGNFLWQVLDLERVIRIDDPLDMHMQIAPEESVIQKTSPPLDPPFA